MHITVSTEDSVEISHRLFWGLVFNNLEKENVVDTGMRLQLKN